MKRFVGFEVNVSILIGSLLHDRMLFVCSTSGDEDCKTFTADEEIEFDSSKFLLS